MDPKDEAALYAEIRYTDYAEVRRLYQAEISALQQQLAAAREAMQAAEVDAARYRWLRDKANDIEADGPLVFMTGRNGHPVGHIWDSILYGESLDAAIDATLQRDRQP